MLMGTMVCIKKQSPEALPYNKRGKKEGAKSLWVETHISILLIDTIILHLKTYHKILILFVC